VFLGFWQLYTGTEVWSLPSGPLQFCTQPYDFWVQGKGFLLHAFQETARILPLPSPDARMVCDSQQLYVVDRRTGRIWQHTDQRWVPHGHLPFPMERTHVAFLPHVLIAWDTAHLRVWPTPEGTRTLVLRHALPGPPTDAAWFDNHHLVLRGEGWVLIEQDSGKARLMFRPGARDPSPHLMYRKVPQHWGPYLVRIQDTLMITTPGKKGDSSCVWFITPHRIQEGPCFHGHITSLSARPGGFLVGSGWAQEDTSWGEVHEFLVQRDSVQLLSYQPMVAPPLRVYANTRWAFVKSSYQQAFIYTLPMISELQFIFTPSYVWTTQFADLNRDGLEDLLLVYATLEGNWRFTLSPSRKSRIVNRLRAIYRSYQKIPADPTLLADLQDLAYLAEYMAPSLKDSIELLFLEKRQDLERKRWLSLLRQGMLAALFLVVAAFAFQGILGFSLPRLWTLTDEEWERLDRDCMHPLPKLLAHAQTARYPENVVILQNMLRHLRRYRQLFFRAGLFREYRQVSSRIRQLIRKINLSPETFAHPRPHYLETEIARLLRHIHEILRQHRIPLRAILQQALEQFEYERSLFGDDDRVPLSMELHTDGPHFYPGTARKLRRIFFHMLLNAWEACRGLPMCEIRVVLQDIPELQTELRIEDQGLGMSPEEQARMFERGFSSKGKGRGKGLTPADKRLLQQYGELVVISEPSRGTTIRWILDA